MKKARIQIVEDEAIIAMEIEGLLQNLGYDVTAVVNNGEDAIRQVGENRPDLVLMDIRIKGAMDGIETAELIRKRFDVPVIFSTAYLDKERIERAKIVMPFGYVLKPIQERDLKVTLEMALYISKATAERKKAEKALLESEHRFASHIKDTPVAVIEFDTELIVTSWNSSAERMFGFTAEEAIGQKTFDLIIPEYEHEKVAKAVQLGETTVAEIINDNITKDGRIITCHWFNTPMTNLAGETVGLSSICQDITEQKRVERDLLESERKYREVVENATIAICVIQNAHFKFFNSELLRLVQYSPEELSHLQPNDIIHDEDSARVFENEKKCKAGEQITGFSHRIITKGGDFRWVDTKVVKITWEGNPAILVFLTDITVQKQTEELMIHTEKMMSLGSLAAGVAHELNNPLGAILQGAQNITRRVSPGLKANEKVSKKTGIDLRNLQAYLEERKITATLNSIRESGITAADIISNMLQFSRKSESKLAPVDLVRLVENTLDLAGKAYDTRKKYDFRNIKIIKEFESDLPPVLCTETEIQQVILNLLTNAAWATSTAAAENSPRIVLRIQKRYETVRIEVADNGPGMDEETRKRVFEPFFTKKPVGEGTGLGLWVSYMIITENHRGSLEVTSELGKGTRFTIELPVS